MLEDDIELHIFYTPDPNKKTEKSRMTFNIGVGDPTVSDFQNMDVEYLTVLSKMLNYTSDLVNNYLKVRKDLQIEINNEIDKMIGDMSNIK
jgi:hypothetical protein